MLEKLKGKRGYHILYPGGSIDSSHWSHTVVERCLRNSLSQSAKLCYKHHTGCRGGGGREEGGREGEGGRKREGGRERGREGGREVQHGRFKLRSTNSTYLTTVVDCPGSVITPNTVMFPDGLKLNGVQLIPSSQLYMSTLDGVVW